MSGSGKCKSLSSFTAKRNLIFRVLCAITLLLTCTYCSEVLEKSIAKQEVNLLAPGNNYQSSKYEVHFWFEPIDDALFYRLQVVSPAFDSIGGMVLDTLINSSRFITTIDPGNYQWRVRAENGSSKTAFSEPRSFIIELSSIRQQKVTLISPAHNYLTNQNTINFKWGALFGATQYRLQVDTNGFADENKLVYNRIGASTDALLNFNRDHVYQWRVRAENDTVQSVWSQINQLTYDHTPPSKVVLTAPLKEQMLSLPVSLQWNSVASARRYKLYVYKSDSTSLYNQQYPMILSASNYSFNQGNFNERIYWKVSAIDDAGNEGEASELRNFVLQ